MAMFDAMLLRLYQLLYRSKIVISQYGYLSFVQHLIFWLVGRRDHFKEITDNIKYYQPWMPKLTSKVSDFDFTFTLLTFCNSPESFHLTYRSIKQQTYSRWQWVIGINDPSILSDEIFEDERIRSVKVENAAEFYNSQLKLIDTDYVCFIASDIDLETDCLHHVVAYIIQNREFGLIYTDNDYENTSGDRYSYRYKPDFSKVLLFSTNYITDFCILRANTVTLMEEFDVSYTHVHAWKWILNLSDNRNIKIGHLPRILYHKHNEDLPYPTHELERMFRSYFDRLSVVNLDVNLTMDDRPRLSWQLDSDAKISIIIPSKDNADILERCLDSIYTQTDYSNFDVIVVDTGSTEASAAQLYESYQIHENFRVIYDRRPFNFSAVCNLGAVESDADYYVFLNNDTQIKQSYWLDHMLQWFAFDDTGLVGAKMVYPNGRIQHGGIIVGIHGLAENYLARFKNEGYHLQGHVNWYREFIAVTGACMMISRKVFQKVEGFDEEFQIAFSDVLLGYAVNQAGFKVIYTPDVEILHEESYTRKSLVPIDDMRRALDLMEPLLQRGDPFFNASLSYTSPVPIPRIARFDSPNMWYKRLERVTRKRNNRTNKKGS